MSRTSYHQSRAYEERRCTTTAYRRTLEHLGVDPHLQRLLFRTECRLSDLIYA